MKKISYIIILVIVSLSVFLLGFSYNKGSNPNEFYQVYLDGEVLGVVSSKKKLEKYIDKRGSYLKRKFDVGQVYGPTTLDIKRIMTYNDKLSSESEIYEKIEKIKPFTIKGYQFTIKNDKDEIKKIYVIKPEIFENAVKDTIKTFVGENKYESYNLDNQAKIETVGNIVENVYIEDDITYREAQIPVDSKIHLTSSELSKFLLFGTTEDQKKYTVIIGDTIETVAFNNEISTEEFLISNPEFTNKTNLLFPGQEVVIGVTDPQVRVVTVEHSVRDAESDFQSEIRFDPNKTIGNDEVIQKGEKGIERITEKIKKINGTIVFVEPSGGREELKLSIPEIIIRGEKKPTNVADPYSWTWPTQSGGMITSDYAYRINPFSYKRELHAALDIAIGYGANIYTVNHGRVHLSSVHRDYGNYIIINHRNGYYSLYAHLSRNIVKTGQDVASGTLIGYMGSTGASTGPHLHFELWVGEPHAGGYKINPRTFLKSR